MGEGPQSRVSQDGGFACFLFWREVGGREALRLLSQVAFRQDFRQIPKNAGMPQGVWLEGPDA